MNSPYIYELLEISWMLNYDFDQEVPTRVVRDDSTFEEERSSDPAGTASENPPIVYDAEGIPLGQSLEEIRMREEIIQQFWNKWKETHPDQMVYNEKLEEKILLRSVSIVEAKEHSSKSYKSTCAFLNLDEVLTKALPVGRTPAKQGNSNQADFEAMLVMVYRCELWGTIKITVGIRRKPNKNGLKEKVQYGMSAVDPGIPLIPRRDKTINKKKKAPHKK